VNRDPVARGCELAGDCGADTARCASHQHRPSHPVKPDSFRDPGERRQAGRRSYDLVVEAREQPQDLPLIPTLACLYGAGLIGGIAGTVVAGGPFEVAMAQLRGSLVTLLVVRLAAALVGAIAVRYLLRVVVGCEIPLGTAIAALIAGALVNTVGQIALGTAVPNRGPASLVASPVWFALGLAGTFVSYLVLQHGRPLAPSAPGLNPHRERPATFEHATYDECVDAVRETSAGLVAATTRAPLDEVADVVLEGLPYLDAATDGLRRATPPANVPAALHDELVESAGKTREELLSAARNAAVGDDPRLRLADSEGMRDMRTALRELAELGVA
jgi:hypothetical protein